MVREGAGGKVVRRLPAVPSPLEQDHGPLKGKSRFAVQELPSDQLCVYLEGKE
jgi:hypothetical protein